MSDYIHKNVYVGNRYVPKPMGTWDKNNNYESLSIVLWEGSSYTSKKNVPAGIDITNEEYWALSGNYNAQVENYRREVRDMGEYVDTNISDLTDSVNTKIEGMETHVNEAVEDMETHVNEAVENMETHVNEAVDNVNNMLDSKTGIIISEEEPEGKQNTLWYEVME